MFWQKMKAIRYLFHIGKEVIFMKGYFTKDSEAVQGQILLFMSGYKTSLDQVLNLFNLRAVVKEELEKIGLFFED